MEVYESGESARPDLPTCAYHVVHAERDVPIFHTGGNSMTDGRLFETVDVYDPQTGQWEAGPEFPYGVQGPNAITAADRINVFGGLRRDVPREESYLPGAHVLDPKVGKWETLAPMFTRRESMGITLTPDGRIFTCGGHHNLSEDPLEHYADVTEIYDIEADSWTSEAPLPERKAWLDAATVGDGIFAMGGANKLPGPGLKWIDDMHEFAFQAPVDSVHWHRANPRGRRKRVAWTSMRSTGLPG